MPQQPNVMTRQRLLRTRTVGAEIPPGIVRNRNLKAIGAEIAAATAVVIVARINLSNRKAMRVSLGGSETKVAKRSAAESVESGRKGETENVTARRRSLCPRA